MSDQSEVKAAHPWDSDALYAKALRYAETMIEETSDSWKFGFWSTLTLELLGRAALANVSPALLADAGNWENIHFAIGGTPKAKRYTPKSIITAEVFARLESVLDQFDSELSGFCQLHAARRNAELHSSETPFDGIKESGWLPIYYRASQTLLASLGHTLKEFFGEETSNTAEKLIAAASDQTAKSVAGTIKAHATVWGTKSGEERTKLSAQADVWATRHDGHRVDCPSCGCTALVEGEASSAPKRSIDGNEITIKQEYLPHRFECVACSLKLAGLSLLSAAGLGDTYIQTSVYDAAEYYRDDDRYDGYEDDNNEY